MPLFSSSFKDNTSEPKKKSDYGIKIAKAGFDALTAADNDLLFNSAWPSVQFSMVKTMRKTSDLYTPIPHGLGFPTIAFLIGGDEATTVMTGQSTDDTNIYVATGFSTKNVGDVIGTLVIYPVNISVDVEYSYTAVQSVNTPYDPNYGIKMVKPGADIESEDMRDYVLHSRCGSPLVLAVKTQETVNPENPTWVQYTSKLGYPTLNFGYAGVAEGTADGNISYGKNAYKFAPQGGQAAPIAYTDGFTVQTQLQDSRASVICLRSPMFAVTNTAEVIY
jgi:hypothetical protein